MTHHLDGVQLKLERANENIVNLNDEVARFLQRNPRPYEIVREFENDHREYVLRARGRLAVPPRFSVLAGEVVYQLRSSLDHLVYALVEKNGGVHSRVHKFPVCDTSDKFKQACARGDIAGISAAAVQLIDQVQPYKIGNPQESTLLHLDHWWAHDKHRLLVVVATVTKMGRELVVGATPMASGDNSPVEIDRISQPQWGKLSDDGVEMLRISFSKPEPEFYADPEFAAQIAFDTLGGSGPAIVVPTLTKLLKFTRRTIDSFGAEF